MMGRMPRPPPSSDHRLQWSVATPAQDRRERTATLVFFVATMVLLFELPLVWLAVWVVLGSGALAAHFRQDRATLEASGGALVARGLARGVERLARHRITSVEVRQDNEEWWLRIASPDGTIEVHGPPARLGEVGADLEAWIARRDAWPDRASARRGPFEGDDGLTFFVQKVWSLPFVISIVVPLAVLIALVLGSVRTDLAGADDRVPGARIVVEEFITGE